MCGEAAAIGAHALATELGATFGALVVLQEILERPVIGTGDQVDHRHAFELFAIFVAEQLQVRTVGIDMHAVVDVGDGVDRAFQQQLAALFCFA